MYLDKPSFKEDFVERLHTLHVKTVEEASDREKFTALASLVRDYISKKWIVANRQLVNNREKQVYYLSIEFLLGRLMDTHLINLGIRDIIDEGLKELGIDLKTIEEQEEDAGLGNGGLGRLAACYLDSMASLGLPGHGCGIRYRYGLFEQKIVDGYQYELPDNWLREGGYMWEYRRAEEAVRVRFGGNVTVRANGKTEYVHENFETVLAVPYDVPIPGFKNNTVNNLRLWSAQAMIEKYACASSVMAYKHSVEAISDTLYPDDSNYDGKLLRLKQQYFLVSASLQSIVQKYLAANDDLGVLADKTAIHINDTHPALAVPELMRILVDDCGLEWEQAWQITTQTISYTNHTVLPEALEKWPVDMFRKLLPRIYMIIDEINERFCKDLWNQYPGDWDRIKSMAIVADGQVHMAHLAIAGSHSVNGVAKIHTEILKNQVMSNFHDYQPYKFNNKTNGVTHRRWLFAANPLLASLISDTIGTNWIDYPCDLANLVRHAEDASFQERFAAIRLHNKLQLAKLIKSKYGIDVDAGSIFDVHIKRIHAYKRQSLNVLRIMHLYNQLRENPNLDIVPRTFIFGGKAAPGYYKAKKTIKLINTLASMINNDKTVNNKVKVVFLENYNVSLAEAIIPATDVSEQIPAASREACGTASMKFMMNGAVTIGTLDGGNIEIKNAVGDDNIFVFGLTADEVLNYYRYGGYNPWDVYNSDSRVRTVMEQLINGFFPVGREEFKTHYDAFLHYGDQYFVLKDFASYVDAQARLDEKFRDKKSWLGMSIKNIANSGKFSSDRTFSEYAADIWGLNHEVDLRCYCRADEVFSQTLHGCEKVRPDLLTV